jgi:hypothetical protein
MRDDDAIPLMNARLVQITMLRLHRLSMTLVRRIFFRKPTLSERTREIIMWSASLPMVWNELVSVWDDELQMDPTLERINIEAFILPWQFRCFQFLLQHISLGIVS